MWNSALRHPQYFPLPTHEKHCIRFCRYIVLSIDALRTLSYTDISYQTPALKAAHRVSTAKSHSLLSTANYLIPAVASDCLLMPHLPIISLASFDGLEKSVIGKIERILTVISEQRRTTTKTQSYRSDIARGT